MGSGGEQHPHILHQVSSCVCIYIERENVSIRMRCRDPLMFPSFIHTQKRNPQTHLKDPDMFWDFISLRPETTHQVLPPLSMCPIMPPLWVPLCPSMGPIMPPLCVPLCPSMSPAMPPSMGPAMPPLWVPLCPLYGCHYAPSMCLIIMPCLPRYPSYSRTEGYRTDTGT